MKLDYFCIFRHTAILGGNTTFGVVCIAPHHGVCTITWKHWLPLKAKVLNKKSPYLS